MQRRHIVDVFLMRIKCVVKNVIIFDLIFDTNKKKRANPIFRALYVSSHLFYLGSTEFVTNRSKTSKFVKNTLLRVLVSTLFSMFDM